MTAELVGPVPTIRFYDGTVLPYDRPKDSLDPRFKACREHRPACDCREAELAEHIADLREHLKAVGDAAREVLAGHPTSVWEDGPNGERQVGCACTGCQIVRRSAVLTSAFGSAMERDEVDGLDADQVAAGLRWQVCMATTWPKFGQDVCAQSTRRDRGHFHEHLHTADDKPLPAGVVPRCTAGGDCPVHPGANGVHNPKWSAR